MSVDILTIVVILITIIADLLVENPAIVVLKILNGICFVSIIHPYLSIYVFVHP